jgi:uncharacterized protein (DUF58 family)
VGSDNGTADSGQAQFNNAWFWMAALLVGAGLLIGQRTPFVVAACLLTVIPVAWLWKRLALLGVSYERRFDKRSAFPGETVEMTVRITNRKLLPLTWLEVSDTIPMTMPLAEGELAPTYSPAVGTLATVLSLRWYERVVKHYRLKCAGRGIHKLGPVHFRSGDLFALFETEAAGGRDDRVVVYPRIWPLEALRLPAKDPFGERKAHRRLFADPLRTVGIRDHRPEDSLRHVHWKATAHRGDLQVRVFEPAETLNVVILLNVSTFAHNWQGVIPELFERTVSVAASLATWAAGQKYKVGLVANGSVALSDQPVRVPPGRAPGQLAAVLSALAGVTSYSSISIQDLLRRESPRLPWGATLVVVTAIVTDELAAALLSLGDAGRRLALVSLSEQAPPALDGVITHHLTADTPAFQQSDLAAYDAAAALRAAGLVRRAPPPRGT